MIALRVALSPAGLAAVAWCAGCNGLPAREWVDHRTALAALSTDAAAVKSISAECRIVLRRPDGDSAALDGALAAEPPDRLRLRAWKFDRAVFDVTLTPQGLWLLKPDAEGAGAGGASATVDPARIARAWALIVSDFFADPPPEIDDDGGRVFRVRRPWEGGPATVIAEIDRATLTVRSYTFRDGVGVVRQTVRLSDHERFDAVAWPTTIVAVGTEGTVELRLHSVVINGGVPADAFVPPRRAVRVGDAARP
jgi:hypothetical protein